jgi:hypothetical protein
MTNFQKIEKKESAKSKIGKLSDYYIIKGDGTLKLDLAKAAKSDAFKEGIRRIRQHELEVKPPK